MTPCVLTQLNICCLDTWLLALLPTQLGGGGSQAWHATYSQTTVLVACTNSLATVYISLRLGVISGYMPVSRARTFHKETLQEG